MDEQPRLDFQNTIGTFGESEGSVRQPGETLASKYRWNATSSSQLRHKKASRRTLCAVVMDIGATPARERFQNLGNGDGRHATLAEWRHNRVD